MQQPPETKPCPQCGSEGCGPVRCRFSMLEHSQAKQPGDIEFHLFAEIQKATAIFYPKGKS